MPSLVDKFFNIFNFFIGISRPEDDAERELPPVANHKADKPMINEFVKLSRLKNNPESIERAIVDRSSRPFIERRFRTPDERILSFEELIGLIESERIGIVRGSVGAGKSRTIERICQTLQARSERKLVFHVNFGKFIEKFQRNDVNFNEKFSLKFLLSFDSYEYEVFREMSSEGRVLVFFDGFDEIAPTYKSEIINLLQSIKRSTKVSFWLASRTANARELEYELKTRSYELLPFTYDDAKPYLHSILAQVSYDRSRLEGMLESFFTSHSDSLNQPFILGMIEEILLDRHANESLTADVNLIHIFVKRKIEFGEFCDSSLLSLLRLAIHTIFGDRFLLCGDKANRSEVSGSCLIAFAGDKGELRFVDRSIAAFFIAEYVIKNVWIYGSFFPQFEGDRRLLGCILREVMDVRKCREHSLIYDSVRSIIECGKVRERIDMSFTTGLKPGALISLPFNALSLSQITQHTTVLKVTQFKSFRDTFTLLNGDKLHQLLALNPNIFALVLQFADSSDFNDSNLINFLHYINLPNPPLILSFECIGDRSHAIFHRQHGKYQRVLVAGAMSEESFLQTIKNEFGIGILLSAIASRVIGSFYGQFEHITVSTRDVYNQKRLIDYALERRDETCVRFLQSFDAFDAMTENLRSQTILEIAAEHCGEREFRLVTEDERILCEFRDRAGRNLLMIAAQAGNADGVRFLLKLNFDIDERTNELSAADLAYEHNHTNVLNQLLEANSKFPSKFEKSTIESEPSFEVERLRKFVRTSEEMHNSIASGNQQAIDSLCQHHPNLRHFYNLANESAIAHAMRHRKVRLYHLLSSKGLSLSPHEQLHDEFTDYSQKARVIDDYLSAVMRKAFAVNSGSNLRLSTDEITSAFIELSSVPEVRVILKIIASCEGLEIIFDFHRLAVTREIDKRIIVAAHGLETGTSKRQILAALAHALCRTSMRHLFGNDSNPYRKSDVDTQLKFFRITKHCYEHCERDAGMKALFRSLNSESWHKELVAMVPHLIVLYRSDAVRLKFVRETFNDLFEFYEEFVMRKIECDVG